MENKSDVFFDVAIIGGGIAGLTAAIQAARARLKVILFEKKEIGGLSYFGGDLLWTKLYEVAKEHLYIKENVNENIEFPLLDIFEDMKETRNLYLSEYIKVFQRRDNFLFIEEEALIKNVGVIEANGIEYNAKNIIIATGTNSRKFHHKIVDKVDKDSDFVLESHQISRLKKVPKSIVIVGGSTAAFEIAILFSNVGSKVTMLIRNGFLNRFDEDMKKAYLEVIQNDKLELITGASVVDIEIGGRVVYQVGNLINKIDTEHLISAIGFTGPSAYISKIGLESDDYGFVTDEFYRTNINSIYAIGNANNKPKTSTIAIAEAEVAVNHILGYKIKLESERFIRQTIGFYQYSQYGEKEEKLIACKIPYIKSKFPPNDEKKSKEGIKYIKMLFHKYTHEILGIHIISKKASKHMKLILNIIKAHTHDKLFNDENHTSESFFVGNVITDLITDISRNTIENEFSSFFQPKIDLLTGNIVGAESLARFFIDESYRNPLPFIKSFERNGYIVHLDSRTISNACALLVEMENEGMLKDDFAVSVNISPKTLSVISSQMINNIISNYPINKKHLIFEITERNLEVGLNFIPTIKELIESGYQISMDDFSVGNSSLAMLSLINFDEVKIDMGVLPKEENDTEAKLIYENLVNVLKIKDIKITAEGVETLFHEEFLKRLGVNIGQGYYYSRPINQKSFMELIRTSSI